MVKSSAQRTNGPARFRIVVMEAEIPDGADFSQFTQAIQNALRPQAIPPSRPVAQIPRPAPALAPEVSGDEAAAPADAELEEISEPMPRARNGSPRKYPTPKVLHDVDLKAEPSFEALAQGKKPDSDLQKFLVSAYWWKQARNIEAITPDHVNTCYVALKWTPATEDFAAPFRTLKRQGLMEKKKRGLYAINTLGIDRVEKMGK